MKHLKKLLIVALLITTILTSCNSSKKGKWSEDDKKKFHAEMKKGMAEVKDIDKETATKVFDILFVKCQENYSSFAEANSDKKGTEKLVLETIQEYLANGSKKGNWSADDKKKFSKIIMDELKESTILDEYKQRFIDCSLKKFEQKYNSLYNADQDVAGSGKIGEDCAFTLINTDN